MLITDLATKFLKIDGRLYNFITRASSAVKIDEVFFKGAASFLREDLPQGPSNSDLDDVSSVLSEIENSELASDNSHSDNGDDGESRAGEDADDNNSRVGDDVKPEAPATSLGDEDAVQLQEARAAPHFKHELEDPLVVGSTVVMAKARLCRGCNKPGHIKRECPEFGVECKSCHMRGHVSKDCKNKTCYNCGDTGHNASECPAPKVRSCRNCDKIGHAAQACPSPCKICGQGHCFLDCTNSTPQAVQESRPSRGAKAAAGEAKGEKGERKEEDDEDVISNISIESAEEVATSEMRVSLITTIHEQHTSTCRIEFEAIFKLSPKDDIPQRRIASVRFNKDNIVGELSCSGASQLDATTDTCIQEISFLYNPKFADGKPTLALGAALFADGDFGPFTAQMHQIRDLLHSSSVRIVFSTHGGTSIGDRVSLFNQSLAAQRESDPLRLWWPDGKMNPQLGMQLQRQFRPQYRLPAKLQFDSLLEYVTVLFHQLVDEHEKVSSRLPLETTMRIVKMPGGQDRLYLATVEISSGLSLREDAEIEVNFQGDAADKTQYWKARVLAPLPFSPAQDYTVFLYRGNWKDEWGKLVWSDLALPDGEGSGVTSFSPGETVGDFQQRLISMKGIKCTVKEKAPRVGIERQINTLRHMTLPSSRSNYSLEMQLLLGNDLMDLPSINVFKNWELELDIKPAELDMAMERISGEQDKEQREAMTMLADMRGGMACVQGFGGTGKSALFRQLVKVRFMLRPWDGARPCAIWITSPLNIQLNKLASRIFSDLLALYHDCAADEHRPAGQNPRYPVVVRRYMLSTEKSIYEKEARDARRVVLSNTEPLYWDPASDADFEEIRTMAVTAAMATDSMEQQSAAGSDKRVGDSMLSEAAWMLRFSGVWRPEPGQTWLFAKPAEHNEFRDLLSKLARGEVFDKNNRERLTLAANRVKKAVAERADCILMTHDVLSQARAHGPSRPSLILADEGGRASEASGLSELVWSREYTQPSKGAVVISTGDIVPQFRIGDFHQPVPPKIGDEMGAFADQQSQSIFSRFQMSGVATKYFWHQHRYVKDINDMVKFVSDEPRLSSDPALENDKEVARAARLFHDLFKVPPRSHVALISSPDGRAEVNQATLSTFNVSHAGRAIFVVSSLLLGGIKPEQIALVSPYTAQTQTHVNVLQSFKAWCLRPESKENFLRIAPLLDRVRVFTVDSIMGDEVDYLVFDTVVTEKLKFLQDPSRMLLALTRPRFGLVIIANVTGVENAHEKQRWYDKTLYAKLVKWARVNRRYINLGKPKNEKANRNWNVPTTTTENVTRIHAPRPEDQDMIKLFDEDEIELPSGPFDEYADGAGGWDDAGAPSWGQGNNSSGGGDWAQDAGDNNTGGGGDWAQDAGNNNTGGGGGWAQDADNSGGGDLPQAADNSGGGELPQDADNSGGGDLPQDADNSGGGDLPQAADNSGGGELPQAADNSGGGDLPQAAENSGGVDGSGTPLN